MTHVDPPKTVTLTTSQAKELLKRVQKIRTDADADMDFILSAGLESNLEYLEHFVTEIVRPLKKKVKEVPM